LTVYVATARHIYKKKKRGRATRLCLVGPSATSFNPPPCRTPALGFPAYAWRHQRGWELGGPWLIVVAFATAVSYFVVGVRYPVVGSAFARIPGWARVVVPPWVRSVWGSHPTTGQSLLLAIQPIGGLRFVSMGRGWGMSALASIATSALGSGVVRSRVVGDKKRKETEHDACRAPFP